MLEKDKYSFENQRFKAEHTFVLSYLAWLYAQNPVFFEKFSTEEIVNYMKEIKIPWALNYLKNKNPLKYYSEIYSLIENNKKNADVFVCESKISPIPFDVDYSFGKEKIRKPSQKQIEFLKKLNSKEKKLYKDDIEDLDSDIASLTISLLKGDYK